MQSRLQIKQHKPGHKKTKASKKGKLNKGTYLIIGTRFIPIIKKQTNNKYGLDKTTTKMLKQ